jgi:predicted transcriptional regulator
LSEIDKQTRIQASQIELMWHQFDIVNDKITEINKIIKQLEQKIGVFNDESSKSHFSLTPQMRKYVGNFSDNSETFNHDSTSQNHIEENKDDEPRNGTIEYILKKLETASLSTRDIQLMIGRTREHTSRLMKKLYEEDLVNRDVTAKPFKYTITDEGRKRLSKHSSLKIHSPSEYLRSESPVDRLVEN